MSVTLAAKMNWPVESVPPKPRTDGGDTTGGETGGDGPDGNTQIRQLTGAGNNSRPLWTPDGERLTFVSDREGGDRIYWQDAGLGGTAEPLTPLEEGGLLPDGWHPDGDVLMFTKIVGGATPFNLWTVSPGSNPEPFAESLFGANGGSAPGPDGQWVVYFKALEDLANQQIFIQPYPPDGSEFALTQQGGGYPLWSPDGTEIFYRRSATSQGVAAVGEAAQGQEFARVGITLERTPLVTAERLLPITGFQYFAASRDYDITPDGERFIMIFPEQRATSAAPVLPRINVVLNWFEELKQRVPTD